MAEFVYSNRKYRQKGFSTPTGKFELYSTLLEKWGYDPLIQTGGCHRGHG